MQRTYLWLLVLQTLATAFIWGVNTLFLLDAGLSLTEAFIANAAYTAGMVVFEVPTGVVADHWGRRTSFILGALTLLVTTLGYLALWYWGAGIVWWVIVSALIGLGFTFFSGATEAWLVDALVATGFEGDVDTVFGRGQTVTGAAMLVGSIAGGFLAQISLGIPYLMRSLMLIVVIIAAFAVMRDIGYTPVRRPTIRAGVRQILEASVRHGLGNRPVRMFMFAAPFSAGIGVWVFYAFQPYLLELFGDPNAFYLSGIAAAVFAVAQMIGGASVNWVRCHVKTRTGVILGQITLAALALIGIGAAQLLPVPTGFWLAIVLLAVYAMGWALSGPIRQAFINSCIPSQQRATVLSFQSMISSAGGVVSQPALGRVADVYSLGFAYAVAGAATLLQLPFIWAVRRMGLGADMVVARGDAPAPEDLP